MRTSFTLFDGNYNFEVILTNYNKKLPVAKWRMLPLELRRCCTSSSPSSMRNDVFASRLQVACLQITS